MKPTRHFAMAATLAMPVFFGAALGGAARADDMPVVVELYTSQGCSSCPPADALMHELAADPGVIALALHVDYWDYIGWADSFAQGAFTERQKTYARRDGSRMIYTPQMVIGGLDRVEGNDTDAVRALIRAHQEVDRGVTLTLRREGDRLLIEAASAKPLPQGVDVVLVRLMREQTVDIADGENAGHSLTYINIVTDWQRVGEWPGAGPLVFETALTGDDPAVVLLQEPGPAAVLAAAWVP